MSGLGNEGKIGLIWTMDRLCGWRLKGNFLFREEM